MVELLIAIAVLTLGIGAVSSTLVTSSSLNRSSREAMIATSAAQNVLETLHAEPFADVFATYNSSAADDPLGAGSAPGPAFAVPGLDVQVDDPDGFVGEVIMPGPGDLLLEDVGDADLGMPRDLNADGIVDGADHATDYTVLPVRIRVAWRGAAGDQTLEFITTLTRRR